MAWGTDFDTNIYISREIYRTKAEVVDKIDDLNNSINDYESKIKMYASSTPSNIIPADWNEEPINWINIQMNELFELYSEDIVSRYKLGLYLEYLKENNIDSINNKNENL